MVTLLYHFFLGIRDRSLITSRGGGATKRGGGRQVKFYPYKRGGGEKVLAC